MKADWCLSEILKVSCGSHGDSFFFLGDLLGVKVTLGDSFDFCSLVVVRAGSFHSCSFLSKTAASVLRVKFLRSRITELRADVWWAVCSDVRAPSKLCSIQRSVTGNILPRALRVKCTRAHGTRHAAREKLVKISNVASIVFVSFFNCFARLNGHFASLKIDRCFRRLLKINEHSFLHWVVTEISYLKMNFSERFTTPPLSSTLCFSYSSY